MSFCIKKSVIAGSITFLLIFALIIGTVSADTELQNSSVHVKSNFTWDGGVTLKEGPDIIFSPTNNPTAEYDVNATSDLAALKKAAEEGEFAFYTDDSWYSSYGSFSLTGIESVNNTEDWTYYWAIFINGAATTTGLAGNILEDGDFLQFCYGYSNYTEGISPTPANCDSLVNISVTIEEPFSWDGEITLEKGPDVTFSPTSNPTAEYDINATSDLAALDKAAEEGGFAFYTDDLWYSSYDTFSLTGIESVNNTADWTYYWAIFINGATTPSSLAGNTLEDGDLLQFCYGYSNYTEGISPTPADCDNLVNISITVEDGFNWDGEVTLEKGPDITFSPTSNPTADYDVNATSDLAALKEAAEEGGFAFYTDDSWYSSYDTFTLSGIEGVNNTADWTHYWAIFINGDSAPAGLSANTLHDGDLLQFCYGYSNYTEGVSPTPADCDNLINISVTIESGLNWDGEVTLETGPDVAFSPTSNLTAEYDIHATSDLAALKAAAEEGEFAFYTDDSWYSSYGIFTLTGIEGINQTADCSYYWAIFINGDSAPAGLSANTLHNGDLLQFCYGYSNYTEGVFPTPADCDNLVNITVNIDSFNWDGDVSLKSGADFTFSPTGNLTAEYDIHATSDLAALKKAAEAGNFAFYTNDSEYLSDNTLTLTGINGINNTADGSYYWAGFINGDLAPAGFSANILEDGDLLQFCYGYSDSTEGVFPTPTDHENIISISVTITSGETANVRWNTTPLSGDIETPPLVADGKIFVSTWWTTEKKDDYFLYCFNENDGTYLWKNTLAEGVGSYFASPATGGGNVFVRGTNGVLYAVNTTSGLTEWTTTLDGSPMWWSQATSSPVVSGSHLLAVSQTSGTLRKFDFDGNEVQTFNTEGGLESRSSPVVSGEKVYFAAGNSQKLYAIDLESFEENWEFTSPENIFSSPVVGSDTVYFTTASSLYAINKTNGEERWTINISSPSGAGTPALSDGYLYVGEKDGLHTYNALNGSEEWSYTSKTAVVSPAVAGNSVYFATNEKTGTVYCLDSEEGALKWEYKLPEPSTSSFAAFWGSSPFADTDKLYIGCSYYNTLYCFGPKLPLGEPALYASPEGGCAPLNVTFSASGCDRATGFDLNFGDGTEHHVSDTLRGVSVCHTYTSPKDYTATLTISNADQTETRLKNLIIHVITAPVNGTADVSLNAGAPGVNISVPETGTQRVAINITGWTDSGDAAEYIKEDGTVVSILTTDFSTSDGVKTGNVSSVIISSPAIHSSEISPDVGNASVQLHFTMDDYQENASVNTVISSDTSDDAGNAFSVACTGAGLTCNAVAYTVYFTKSGFANESSISSVNLSFTVKNSWITDNGGISDVKIIRWNDDGEKEILTPYTHETTGNYTTLSVTSGGFSVYGVAMTKTIPAPSSGGGSGDSGKDSLTYTSVSIPAGTFNVTADSGRVYTLKYQTAIGILNASGHSYVADDSWYNEYGTLYLKSIDNTENAGSSGWMYQVNGISPSVGANVKQLTNGDQVLWYYSESMSAEPEKSLHKLALKAQISTSVSGSSGGSSGTDSDTATGEENSTEQKHSVDVAIGLPQDSSLNLEDGRMYFSIDIDSAKSSGENIVQDKNSLIVTRGDLILAINYVDFKVRNGVTAGEIESIELKTTPVGDSVRAYLVMDMNNIPVDGLVNLATIEDVDTSGINRLLKDAGSGEIIDNAVFELATEKQNIEDGIDIASATVYMTIPKDLISGRDDSSAFRIVHILENGGIEILTPEIITDDESDLITFRGTSKKGISSFVLATLSSETESYGNIPVNGQAPAGEEIPAQASGSGTLPVFAVLSLFCLGMTLKLRRK